MHRVSGTRPAVGENEDKAGGPSIAIHPTSKSGVSTIPGDVGPMIWTGTRFLPRYVRSALVPGKGLHHFYDDGTRCKSVIDGKRVNPHWGITAAGKPRKRDSVACITCREEHTKCDPDYPQCAQCEQFGRVCRLMNA